MLLKPQKILELILTLYNCIQFPNFANFAVTKSLIITMKLTLICLFLGLVVASPIANMSPNGNVRIKNMDDNSYTTPSEPMISNGPTEGLPNGTHHPWHHKGKHGHGQAEHVS